MEKKQRMFYFGTHGDCKYSPLLVRGNTLPLPDYCDTWDKFPNGFMVASITTACRIRSPILRNNAIVCLR